MRKLTLFFFVFALAVPVLIAKDKDKNKDFLPGKILEVKTQDMDSSSYSNPNNVGGDAHAPSQGMTGRGMTGGSFSAAPTHFVIYNIVLQTDDEIIMAKLSREISFRPPDIKAGSDVKWKAGGPKFVQVMDRSGKKFDFEVTRREKRTDVTPKTASTPAPTA